MELIEHLKNLSQNAYGKLDVKSAAAVIFGDNCWYTGVNILIGDMYTSAIENAIYAAVAEGYRKLNYIVVYFDTEKTVEMDDFSEECISLMHEFGIHEIILTNKNNQQKVVNI